jgi:hypothetical protein
MSAAPMLVGLILDTPPSPVAARRVPVRAHLRRVTGSEAPTGAERKDTALVKHASRVVLHRAIEYVREHLRALYRERAARSSESAFVTADDVERVLREWSACPDEAKPAFGPQRWRGAVFRGPGWRQTGRTVPSLRPHMNGTALPCWIPTETTR